MASSQHPLEAAVDDVAAWVEEMAVMLAESLSENGRAPFAQRLTERQRFEFFNAQLWNDDGTPNEAGRNQLLQRRGLQEYVDTYRWVEQRRNREMRGSTRREWPATAAAATGAPDEEEY